MEFGPSEEGLYYYDFMQSVRQRETQEEQQQKAMVVTTVEEIKRSFMKKEVEAADEARRLHVIMGRPSQKVFEEIIKKGKLINNPVTVQD
jgi:hypothetical protein